MELRRHELVRLTAAGWRAAAAQHRDPRAAHCVAHWSANDLPLVVASQAGALADLISLGLPAPAAWGRGRYALRLPRADLRRGLDAFPGPAQCGFPFLRTLTGVRVHGSFGWQCLTGLGYVHSHSDLDLSIAVDDAEHADAVVARLAQVVEGPRLDGELSFADGSAVAWREWQAWRAGSVSSLLVRRLRGASLERDAGWLQPALEDASR